MVERAQHRIGREAAQSAQRAVFHRIAKVAQQRRLPPDRDIDARWRAGIERLAEISGAGLFHLDGRDVARCHDPVHDLHAACRSDTAWRAFAAAFDRAELHGEARHLRHRSEEHTSELQSLMRISYAVFCLKKKKKTITDTNRLNTIRKEHKKS